MKQSIALVLLVLLIISCEQDATIHSPTGPPMGGLKTLINTVHANVKIHIANGTALEHMERLKQFMNNDHPGQNELEQVALELGFKSFADYRDILFEAEDELRSIQRSHPGVEDWSTEEWAKVLGIDVETNKDGGRAFREAEGGLEICVKIAENTFHMASAACVSQATGPTGAANYAACQNVALMNLTVSVLTCHAIHTPPPA